MWQGVVWGSAAGGGVKQGRACWQKQLMPVALITFFPYFSRDWGLEEQRHTETEQSWSQGRTEQSEWLQPVSVCV